MTINISDYEYRFQISPIALINGIAKTGVMGIETLLQQLNYSAGLTGRAAPGSPTFASFRPIPGHTLMNNEVATYPFSNQTTAANAIITAPLEISLEMLVPANSSISMDTKLSIITNLKQRLDQHTALGGWYNVSTPSYVYQGCLLTTLVDATEEDEGGQTQVRWVWNFMQPLITASTLQGSQNQGMAKTTNQTYSAGDPPGYNPITVYYNDPSANISQNFVPSNAGSLAANLAPPSSSLNAPSLTSISPISVSL